MNMIISACESLQGKALTVSKTSYYIGEKEVPFDRAIIKNGCVYYLKPLSEVLEDMGFKNAILIAPDVVICSGYDPENKNIKSVGIVTDNGVPRIKVILKSEFEILDLKTLKIKYNFHCGLGS